MAAGNIFHFKQFSVDQSGCAMKVNTDGVLLGALLTAASPQSILDIGAGTGVIALMLAQRFETALIDAVEIDAQAAKTAESNFKNSLFSSRLNCHFGSYENYFDQNSGRKFDLIVSNPPFFLNSLKSATDGKRKARHSDIGFFVDLFRYTIRHLKKDGRLTMILPVDTVAAIVHHAEASGLFLQSQTAILSFVDSRPHRKIVTFGFRQASAEQSQFIIYAGEKVYSEMYQTALKEYLTIF